MMNTPGCPRPRPTPSESASSWSICAGRGCGGWRSEHRESHHDSVINCNYVYLPSGGVAFEVRGFVPEPVVDVIERHLLVLRLKNRLGSWQFTSHVTSCHVMSRDVMLPPGGSWWRMFVVAAAPGCCRLGRGPWSGDGGTRGTGGGGPAQGY